MSLLRAVVAVVVTLACLVAVALVVRRRRGPGSPPRMAADARGGAGAALFGAGVLELQALLQPDRKVEIVLEQVKEPDRFDPAHRPASAGDLGPTDRPL